MNKYSVGDKVICLPIPTGQNDHKYGSNTMMIEAADTKRVCVVTSTPGSDYVHIDNSSWCVYVGAIQWARKKTVIVIED